jgi:predicted  nucleic acid-binding Zn-ribbon protein
MDQQCISVDKSKVQRAIELGWNISAICQAAIDEVLSGDSEDLLYAIRLRRIEDEIATLKLKVYEMTGSLNASQDRVEYLQGQRDEMKIEQEKTKYTVRMTQLITQLNKIAWAAEYNVDIIEETGKDVIQKIKELNPSFDVKKQVQRFKMLMQEP